MQFHDLSYSEDRKKVIGLVFGGKINGIVELDLSDNSVKQIISIEDINKQLEKIGVETLANKYSYLDDILTLPKYYNDGYTFIFKGDIYFLQDKGEDFSITQINNRYIVNAYFIDKKGRLYLREENGDIIVDNNAKEDTYVLVYNKKDLGIDKGSSLFDMSNDKKEILYYDLQKICIYDTEKSKNIGTVRHFSMYQYIFDLRLSEDNRYIFYTLGEGSFMNTGDYRYNFYIVDTKTGSRIHLKRFDYSDYFYGFDW